MTTSFKVRVNYNKGALGADGRDESFVVRIVIAKYRIKIESIRTKTPKRFIEAQKR